MAPLGKFFFIRQVASGLVIQLEQGKDKPGNTIVMGYQLSITEERQHQLWYLHPSSSTIRSRYNDHCIDLKDDTVVANAFHRQSANQRWTTRDSRISNKDEPDSVLAMVDANPTEGTRVFSVDTDGTEKEIWEMDHVTAEYFYLKSQDSEKVLEVSGSDENSGAKVILYENRSQLLDHQLWYEDVGGIIRSKLNGFALSIAEKSNAITAKVFTEDDVCMQPYDDEDPRQKWVQCGASIQNKLDSDEVMEIRGGGWFTNPYICPAKYNASSNQLWVFDYIPNQVMSLSHPGIGKFIRIMSRHSSHFFTLKDGSVEAGTQVVLWDRKSEMREAIDQLWYIDEKTGTIRSSLNDYCLDLNDNYLIVNPYESDSRTQQWKVAGSKIYCVMHPEKALQVEGNSEDYGAGLTISIFRGIASQLWEIQHVPSRCFFIKSFACEKIMGVKNENRDSGGVVGIYTKKPELCASQLWYEDENGYIRSTLNGYVIDTNDADTVKLRPFKQANKSQHWLIMEDTIQHQHENNKVLDIKRGWTLIEGTAIVANPKNESNHQLWYFEYLS